MKFPNYLESFAYEIADAVLDKMKQAYEAGFNDGQVDIAQKAEAIVEAMKAEKEKKD